MSFPGRQSTVSFRTDDDSPRQLRTRGIAVSQTALAHHWLVTMGGGEKVLEQFSELFPDAPIYTLVATRDRLSERLQRHEIIPSAFGRLPGAAAMYKQALPIFPLAFGTLKIAGTPSLILSSDASMIKGIAVPSGAPHVCYCHSPPRYLWDAQATHSLPQGMGSVLLKAITPALRKWDRAAAQRVDFFIANSQFIRERIRAAYGRESEVISPPVAVEDFTPLSQAPDDFYLVVSRLVPYKRIDIAIEAFGSLGKRLVVIGDGSEYARLRKSAGKRIEFLGAQPFRVLRDHYARCRALIFPGVEDFGITPLEAQASGRPVIAFGKGGALETVKAGETGLFFERQNGDCLASAVIEFERRSWDTAKCRLNALRFGAARFRSEISAFLRCHGLPSGAAS
ncbi:MAG: glycosyltransferase [Terrimicrobiaceae bacterium]